MSESLLLDVALKCLQSTLLDQQLYGIRSVEKLVNMVHRAEVIFLKFVH